MKPRFLHTLLLYLPLLLISIAVFDVLWFLLVFGKLYYCGDPVPILSMIPPYVHDVSFDKYYVQPWIVNVTGLATWILAFLIPVALTKWLMRYSKKLPLIIVSVWILELLLELTLMGTLFNLISFWEFLVLSLKF